MPAQNISNVEPITVVNVANIPPVIPGQAFRVMPTLRDGRIGRPVGTMHLNNKSYPIIPSTILIRGNVYPPKRVIKVEEGDAYLSYNHHDPSVLPLLRDIGDVNPGRADPLRDMCPILTDDQGRRFHI